MADPRLNNPFVRLALAFLFIMALLFIIPWRIMNWGKIQISPSHSITVQGEARSQQQNQVARFTAGVTSINDDKQVATQEVNQKVTALIEAVKTFGIKDADVQTQSISVYQMEEAIDAGVSRVRQGQWRASNDIQVTLRDIKRASELTDLLTQSGATNVYGPNFTIEDLGQAEAELLSKAVENARQKAQSIAEQTGQKLGKVISIVESGSTMPPYLKGADSAMGLGGGGSPIEPGSATVSKSATVTFELR